MLNATQTPVSLSRQSQRKREILKEQRPAQAGMLAEQFYVFPSCRKFQWIEKAHLFAESPLPRVMSASIAGQLSIEFLLTHCLSFCPYKVKAG